MRAIIIHSDSRMIIEADLQPNEHGRLLSKLQEIVGGSIEAVYGLPDEHHCYVNEEGLLQRPRAFFMFTNGHQPLAGTGVILASTDGGDEAPCRLELDWVKGNVKFMDLWQVQAWARNH